MSDVFFYEYRCLMTWREPLYWHLRSGKLTLQISSRYLGRVMEVLVEDRNVKNPAQVCQTLHTGVLNPTAIE